MSRDPIGYSSGRGSLYEYVRGRVVGAIDPYGLVDFDYLVEYHIKKRREDDPERQDLLREADKFGLSSDVEDVFRRVDSLRCSNIPIIEGRLVENYLRSDIIVGPCGRWTRQACRKLVGSDADRNERIDLRSYMIQQNSNPGGSECQNCIRITFRDDEGNLRHWYLDDGQVGGDGGVFSHEQAVDFQGSGKGSMFETGYIQFDNHFGR